MYQRHVPTERNVTTFDGLKIQSLFYWCWGEFLKCSAGVNTFLFISKINSNTEIRDRNLSPSKVVTFLYVGTTYMYLSLFLARVNHRQSKCGGLRLLFLKVNACGKDADRSEIRFWKRHCQWRDQGRDWRMWWTVVKVQYYIPRIV